MNETIAIKLRVVVVVVCCRNSQEALKQSNSTVGLPSSRIKAINSASVGQTRPFLSGCESFESKSAARQVRSINARRHFCYRPLTSRPSSTFSRGRPRSTRSETFQNRVSHHQRCNEHGHNNWPKNLLFYSVTHHQPAAIQSDGWWKFLASRHRQIE